MRHFEIHFKQFETLCLKRCLEGSFEHCAMHVRACGSGCRHSKDMVQECKCMLNAIYRNDCNATWMVPVQYSLLVDMVSIYLFSAFALAAAGRPCCNNVVCLMWSSQVNLECISGPANDVAHARGSELYSGLNQSKCSFLDEVFVHNHDRTAWAHGYRPNKSHQIAACTC